MKCFYATMPFFSFFCNVDFLLFLFVFVYVWFVCFCVWTLVV